MAMKLNKLLRLPFRVLLMNPLIYKTQRHVPIYEARTLYMNCRWISFLEYLLVSSGWGQTQGTIVVIHHNFRFSEWVFVFEIRLDL